MRPGRPAAECRRASSARKACAALPSPGLSHPRRSISRGPPPGSSPDRGPAEATTTGGLDTARWRLLQRGRDEQPTAQLRRAGPARILKPDGADPWRDALPPQGPGTAPAWPGCCFRPTRLAGRTPRRGVPESGVPLAPGQAIAFQESLTRQYPSVLHNSIALADSLQKLAEVELVLERPEAAVANLESARTPGAVSPAQPACFRGVETLAMMTPDSPSRSSKHPPRATVKSRASWWRARGETGRPGHEPGTHDRRAGEALGGGRSRGEEPSVAELCRDHPELTESVGAAIAEPGRKRG